MLTSLGPEFKLTEEGINCTCCSVTFHYDFNLGTSFHNSSQPLSLKNKVSHIRFKYFKVISANACHPNNLYSLYEVITSNSFKVPKVTWD